MLMHDPHKAISYYPSAARIGEHLTAHLSTCAKNFKGVPAASLKLSSVVHEFLIDDIRERVLAMWPEGVLFSAYREDLNEFDVRFCGHPWSASGQLGVMAMKMILELFAVLGRKVCGLFVLKWLRFSSCRHRDTCAHLR